MNPLERLIYVLAYAACRAWLDAKADQAKEVNVAQPAPGPWRAALDARLRAYAAGRGAAGMPGKD